MSVESFDMGLILKHLVINEKQRTREKLLLSLQSLKEFEGALGPLTTSEKQVIERPVKILTVRNGRIQPDIVK